MSAILSRLAARPRLTVLVFGLLLLTSGNWILPLLDRDEPRFAEAGREMRQRDDWVVPWFNGDYRFDKPPLIYWCETVSYRVLGENEFAARLPGVLFSLATALLLVEWGRRLNRPRAGFFGALMYLGCVQVQIHGRLAVADMPMVFFYTLAAWSGWEFTRPGVASTGSARRWWLAFFGALGLGFLAKGPEAWLPILGLAILGRRWPAGFSLRAGQAWVGLFITLAITAAWGVPAMIRTQGQFLSIGLGHHVIYRSVGVVDGHGAAGWEMYVVQLPLYLLTFFFSFFPWGFRVPGRLCAWWPERRQNLPGSYLLVQAAIVFTVFTLVRTKLPHYTLPAFPLLALWLALQLEGQPDFSRWFGRRLIGMTVVLLALTWIGFAALRPEFVAEEIWAKLAPQVRPETRVASVGYGEASLVWKFRAVTTNYLVLAPTPGQVTNFLAQPGPWIFITPKGYAPPIPAQTNSATAITITGGDVSRWNFTRQPFRLGRLTLPGWTLRPRQWELTAWLSPDPKNAGRTP